MSMINNTPSKKKSAKPVVSLAPGEILQDVYQKKWLLGEPFARKGAVETFYSAKPVDSKLDQWNQIAKIKPIENGPIFVEMHFYKRCAKDNDVRKYKEGKNLKHLGIPGYITSGTHVCGDEKYRFILMQKYAAKSVWSRFVENSRKMPPTTAYRIALQIVDVLEYIHSRGYIHGDVKGANILLDSQYSDRIYLVDFGLCGKFTKEPKFKPNIGKIPNQSLAYLSRDGHQLVPTRRGDIEMLFNNLIHWLTGTLPWEDMTNHKTMLQSKIEHMTSEAFLQSYFKFKVPESLENLLKYINSMTHIQKPDYKNIKMLLAKCLGDYYDDVNMGPLNFTSTQKRKLSSPEPPSISTKKCKCDDAHILAPVAALGPTTTKTLEMLRIEAMIREKQSKKMIPRKKRCTGHC